MISRALAALRDPNGRFQRFVAPTLAVVGIAFMGEYLRARAQQVAGEWEDWRDRSERLVQSYGAARDAYDKLTDSLGEWPAGGHISDVGTFDQAIEDLRETVRETTPATAGEVGD